MRIHDDPNTGGDGQGMTVNQAGPIDGAKQGLLNFGDFRDMVQATQDPKTISTQFGDDAVMAQTFAEIIRDLNQQLIARFKSVHIVDVFEIVDVDISQNNHPRRILSDPFVEDFGETIPVR